MAFLPGCHRSRILAPEGKTPTGGCVPVGVLADALVRPLQAVFVVL